MRSRTVLVTGAAKRLGAAIARRLAADGHRVVIHYNGSVHEAAALAVELGAVAVQGDLSDLDGIDALFCRARDAAGGPIDGLVNSASAFVFDRPPEPDATLMAKLYAINAAAPALLASALARQDDVTDGAVVDILDQKLANPNPDFFAYSCAKFALAGANTMLAQALGSRIAVNAVAPGLTLQSGDQSDAEFAAASAKNLLGRPIGAGAVAEAVSFLLTASGIRGQTLYVDCGQRFCRRDGDVMFEGRV
ncbi:SDR family NAD(P)-dependent oxidoreductase [Sphingomonas sp. SORGH_AS_0879]|uniref:SDR family NAD(P)-dependent oxidoreductase n=1 Tax=Sphingomonas sp. SORGH_AS_0879 TaxID=3041790 RepID=UPI00278776E7|nr:SDR family NAD(P)-dependent oxidoreductase [Sphingomonas sp. SORGH_AS_0879]MDQ1230119.1 NAD(P)-dependent dehydrogenase (short-subunit alcohol dehydrogenase family) [Sphingomonas sp. SORGH_AS_0879]